MKIPHLTTAPKITADWIPIQKAFSWTTTIRILKLHLLWHFSTIRSHDEVRKIALYKHRGAALLHTVLHILPFTAAVLLVVLNFKSAFIGDVQSSRVIALQFAAKFLEVLIQASIAATTLGIFRQHVLQRNELPFGGLMAPYRTADISFLWSLEFWGCVTSPSLKLKQKIMFCLILPTAVLLAALVGPSSAVLMIPRPMNRPQIERIWLLDEAVQLYPTTVELGPEETLPEEDLFNQTSNQAVINFSDNWPLPMVDVGGPRGMKWLHEFIEDDAWTHRKLATVPTLLTAQAGNVHNYTGKASAFAPQPLVYIDCCARCYDMSYGINTSFVSFGPSKAELNNYLNLSTMLPNYTQPPNDHSLAIYQTTSNPLPGQNWTLTESLVWSSPPPNRHNHSLLMAFGRVYTDIDIGLNESNMQVSDYTACTIDAYWANITTDVSLNSIAQTFPPESQNDEPAAILAHVEDKTLISLSPEWAQKVGISIAERSAADTFANPYGANDILSYTLALSYQPDVHTYFANFTQLVSPGSGYLGDQYNIWRYYWGNLSHSQYDALVRYIPTMNFGIDYEIYLLTNSTTWTDPSTLAQVRIISYQAGYGYDLAPMTVKLALAVILFYLAATTAYLLYSVFTGYAATSWDSIAELTALALNSERPKDLANTSVGIDTLETFRRPVSIQVNQQDSLEIVFEGPSPTGMYKRVMVNERY